MAVRKGKSKFNFDNILRTVRYDITDEEFLRLLQRRFPDSSIVLHEVVNSLFLFTVFVSQSTTRKLKIGKQYTYNKTFDNWISGYGRKTQAKKLTAKPSSVRAGHGKVKAPVQQVKPKSSIFADKSNVKLATAVKKKKSRRQLAVQERRLLKRLAKIRKQLGRHRRGRAR